jgi:hypothetical protein
MIDFGRKLFPLGTCTGEKEVTSEKGFVSMSSPLPPAQRHHSCLKGDFSSQLPSVQTAKGIFEIDGVWRKLGCQTKQIHHERRGTFTETFIVSMDHQPRHSFLH